ncbi:17358_t:CDS:2 [Cetraspora pellucida]|uniref:17358_t:CDS:1 n=1 Tax=Cetraspora pellucida TaxID=1433469 RepID=A0A9N9JTH7_9GLOM|nr:17358_t:CDS:2 [Cetraspora pellucida]
MFFIKKIIKKIFTKQSKKYNVVNDYWPDFPNKEIISNHSSELINKIEDSTETSFPFIEYEEQFSILDLKFYTRYEDYLEAFSYFEAHARSWVHIDIIRKKYIRNKFDQELSDWRYYRYEEDFDKTVKYIFNKNF